MARIPDSELNALKSSTDLKCLIEEDGVNLKKEGNDYSGICPFHEEKTASLKVTLDKGLWHCFSCGKGGSAIDWLIKYRKLSFLDSVEYLRKRIDTHSSAASSVATSVAPSVVSQTAKVSTLSEFQKNKYLLDVVDYYHETFLTETTCRKYLRSRGLEDEDLIETFQIGFSNRSLFKHLSSEEIERPMKRRKALQEIGIYRASGHEHFRGSLVIPLLEEERSDDGSSHIYVREMYGRKVGQHLRPGTPDHLYLPGSHRGIFNRRDLQQSSLDGIEEVILCESFIDALSFWKWGFKNVTSTFGTRGMTDEIFKYLISHFKRVQIAFDCDESGNASAQDLAKRLNEEGLEVKRVAFPLYADANSFCLSEEHPKHALKGLLLSSQWLGVGELYPSLKKSSAESTLEQIKEPLTKAARKEKAQTSSPLTKSTQKQLPSSLVAPSSAAFSQRETTAPETSPISQSKLQLLAPKQASPAHLSPRATTVSETSPISQSTLQLPALKQASPVVFEVGEREYRVLGLSKNRSLEVLKVNLRVKYREYFHLDTLDLYLSRARGNFIQQASIELGLDTEILKSDLGKLLFALEKMQEESVQEIVNDVETVTLTEDERSEAQKLLQDPLILSRLLEDLEEMGLVGEEKNKLTTFLCTISRKLNHPLGLIIQSVSAGGKTSLLDGVLSLLPPEDLVRYSAMSGQSLFYMGENGLQHKVLCIAEEEGAKKASYSLKLLQSEGELLMASASKDESGRQITREYRTEGPTQLCMTTTGADLDPELQNRCLVLTVDESQKHTQKIQAMQREYRTRKGMLKQLRSKEKRLLWQNAQRLLEPLAVANPFAEKLTFVSDRPRTRRDQMKYLSLMESVAFLRQKQKKILEDKDGQYIEVDLFDAKVAGDIALHALGRSLDDLPPQSRNLLKEIENFVRTRCTKEKIEASHVRFSRRELRENFHWGDTQLKIHLNRLEEMEYLQVHREDVSKKGGRGRYLYELLEMDEEKNLGLIELSTITNGMYDSKRSGLETVWSGGGRPMVGLGATNGSLHSNGVASIGRVREDCTRGV